MEIPLSLIFLGVLVFVSYTAQAMTGFGSIVIALTIGALFFEMRTILPVLVALNLLLCIWILYRGFRAIDTSVLFQKILPLMGAGVALGVLVSQTWDGPLLRRLFGGIIAAFALRELVFLLFFQNKTQKPL
ncbi:MAG TPA: hypothetical protein PLY93_11335, partial [Turneriella sp.]|nr:hypothetical protein [Turneriella sp.]